MYFWSKGLGKRGHVVIPCGTETCELSPEGGALILKGTTLPPIVWSYTITMDEKDFLAILRLGLSPIFVGYLLHPRRIRSCLLLGKYLLLFLFRYLTARPLTFQQGETR